MSIGSHGEPLLEKVEARTLKRHPADVSVIIPAHNEAATIAEVISQCQQGLGLLGVDGEVIVSASGCTDETGSIAHGAGATVVEAPAGKGAAIMAGVDRARGDVICLVDGDLQYYGDTPLVTLLVNPIIHGIADACITNLYWRPIYPDQWLHGFFAPIAGWLFPELLPKAGSTPWSGQRAAKRELWPASLPGDFTADLALLLHWNSATSRLRPVLTDDWFNPVRPKPEQMALDFHLMVDYAVQHGRIEAWSVAPLNAWFEVVQSHTDAYKHGHDDPSEYEQRLLQTSMQAFRRFMQQASENDLIDDSGPC